MALEKEPISYYSKLLTSEYQLSTNLLSWLTAALTPLDDATTCYSAFRPAFDIATAAGVQLDTLGAEIGAARLLPYQPAGGLNPLLDDTTYRIFLRARIAQNHWDGTLNSLQAIWTSLFPGGSIVVTDSQNMTATVLLSGVFTSIIQSLIINGYIVPRPEGVLYTFTFATLPALGFDKNDSFIAGLDVGKFT